MLFLWYWELQYDNQPLHGYLPHIGIHRINHPNVTQPKVLPIGHTNWYNFLKYYKLKQDNMRIMKIVVTFLKIFGKDFFLLCVTVQEANKWHTLC